MKPVTACVIIPTKNRPAGLRRAVCSALGSALSKDLLSVIVVDDGCDTPAVEVLSDFSFRRLTIITNKGVPGPAGARNFGVSVASSEIIFFLDDDDQLLVDYVPSILAALEGDASAADYGFSSTQRGIKIKNIHGPSGMFGPQTALAHRLGAFSAGFWISRKCFIDVGGIDERLRINEDTEFCVRLAAMGFSGWFSSSPGVSIRPEQGNCLRDMTSITENSRAAERKYAFEVILEQHAGFLSQHPQEKLRFISRVVKYLARSGDFAGALKFARAHQAQNYRTRFAAILGVLTRSEA